MSITAAGWYGKTLQKMLSAASLPAGGLDSETAVKVLLVTDSYTPDYTNHDFRDDITGEVPNGNGYTTGGNLLTGTTLTVASGLLTWDAANTQWVSSTITDAMAAVCYFARGGAASADELILLADFVTPVSTVAGTLDLQWAAAGIGTWDFTP
jgi:hypothetical protein